MFEPTYYNDIVKAKFSFSLKYLWFLVFLTLVVKSFGYGASYIKNRPYIKPGVDKFVTDVSKFYPSELELRIRQGELSTNVKEPYIFDLERKIPSDKHLIIIDTKGLIDNYPSYNTYVLATRKAMIYPSKSQSNRTETSIFYFKDIKNSLTFNRNSFDRIINMAKPYSLKATFYSDIFIALAIVIGPIFLSTFTLFGIIFGLLFLNFIVWIFNLLIKKKFNYSTLYRLSMHGISMPIILSELFKLAGIVYGSIYWISYFIFMGVVLFALKTKKS
ncbi:MAG: hypothetical protein UR68_C0012G0012 [Candidatus Roizmanbacteria bacterium GW2011_GWA2_35_19]|uniref:DUF1189 domain-containing protein n=2 Tax=Candidatus Roizmaniibacteriota TaxID=1752723 RepID=A0A0G0BTN4_9BACT|nr:MAG: hypothetical protein UR63_C0031G0012 [Candidatus Roizmanbacteria bacterium GW2011_GWC2_35_12]KKP72819.1 MAG: hypothetical protein UR68_C0012G0012 [Candidatus Roizmanbacteria bacterium GW2011_GWA2_35_19]